MRKIFNRTTALLLLCVINIVVIVMLFVFEERKNDTGSQTYSYESIEEYDYDEYLKLEKRVINIERKTLNSYIEFECDTYNPSPLNYTHYYVDVIDDSINLFTSVNLDTLLGTKDSIEVYPSLSGKIVNIQKDSSDYDITVYSETEFRVDLYIDKETFYNYDLSNTNNMLFEISENSTYQLEFIGFDYYNGFVDGYIKGTYKIIDPEQSLISGAYGYVKKLDSTYENVLCFSNEYKSGVEITDTTLSFLRKNNDTGKFYYIDLLVKKTIGGYYIIETNSLNEGDTIYAI